MGMDRGGIVARRVNLSMAPLLGIQSWGRGRAPCHCAVGMRGPIVLDDDGSMHRKPCPAHAQRPLDVVQGRPQIRGPEGRLHRTRVALAGPRQAHHRGLFPACAQAPHDRGLSACSPRRTGLGGASFLSRAH